MEGGEAIKCSVKNTFYIDPRVEGYDDLATRAKRLGLKTRGFLGAEMTVCVVATAAAAVSGADRTAGEASAAAAVNSKYSRRRDRIHRMVSQAQSEPEPEPEAARQPQASVTDQARRLHALVLPGQVFRLWLEGLESKRAPGGKGKAAARPLISRGQRAGTSRFKSQEHPRVVIKDLDGLEPDRVQAFPPELLRKCNLHTDAPPGICPFTPREQWEREALRVKKKDAQNGAGKVADRTPPGPRKARRGGWCECCAKQYIGTMSAHCAGEEHRVCVAADPNFEVLLALQSWTAADDEMDSPAANHGAENGAAAQSRAHGNAAVAPGPFGSAAASSANLPAISVLAAPTSAVSSAAAVAAASAPAVAAAAAAASTVVVKMGETTATDASQSLPTRHGAGRHLAVIGRRNDAHACGTAGAGGAEDAQGAQTVRRSGGSKDTLPGHRKPASTSGDGPPPSRGACGGSPTRLAHGGGRDNGKDSMAKENVPGAAAVVAAAAPPPSPSRRRETAALPGASAPGSSPQRSRRLAPAPGKPAEAVEGRVVGLGEGRRADQPETAASVQLQQHLTDADGLKANEVDASVSPPGRSRPCRGGGGSGGGSGDSGGSRGSGDQEGQTSGSSRGGRGEPGPVSGHPAKESPVGLRRKSRQERELEQLADSPGFVGPSACSSRHEEGRGGRGGRGGRRSRTTRLGLGGSVSSAGGGGGEVSSPGTAQKETGGGVSGSGCSPSAKPNKRRRREEKGNHEEGQQKGGMKGGLLSADDTRESEQSRSCCATRAAASTDWKKMERRGGGGGRGSESASSPSSSSPTVGQGVGASRGMGAGGRSAGSPAEGSRGKRPKRARKSPVRFRNEDESSTANLTTSCGSARAGGRLSGARVPTPTTTGRMGLEKPTYAFQEDDEDSGGDGGGGDGGGGDTDQSSPLSSGLLERTRSNAPRRVLERKFCEDHVSGGEVFGATNSRAKRTAGSGADFGELESRGPPPPKRTRALIVANSSCTRSGTRRH